MRGSGPHPSMMPQSAHVQKGVGPFLPTKVAAIIGPRYVAKFVRSAAALWGDGGPTPHQACPWLLTIIRKLTATLHA